MKTCPNCSKILNENFIYCNECGCMLDGDEIGDFRICYLNVFEIHREFIYLYSVNGRQVILKADSIGELEKLVRQNRFPWAVIKKDEPLKDKVSRVNDAIKDCTIIGLKKLERNPMFSNLDKMYR